MTEVPATHVVIGIETAVGVLFTVGTAAITTVVGVIMRRVGEMRTQLVSINNAMRELNGKMARIEEWRQLHMREVERRMEHVEQRIASCAYFGCPVREAREKGD